MVDSEKTK